MKCVSSQGSEREREGKEGKGEGKGKGPNQVSREIDAPDALTFHTHMLIFLFNRPIFLVRPPQKALVIAL